MPLFGIYCIAYALFSKHSLFALSGFVLGSSRLMAARVSNLSLVKKMDICQNSKTVILFIKAYISLNSVCRIKWGNHT